MPRVRFEFDDDESEPVEFGVGYGSNLYRAALARSLRMFNGPMRVLNCWGKGYCGACFVEVRAGCGGLPERTDVERRKLGKAPASVRLACQVPVTADIVIAKPSGILRPRPRHGAPDGGSPDAAGRGTEGSLGRQTRETHGTRGSPGRGTRGAPSRAAS